MSDAPSHGAEFDRDRVYPVLPLRDIVVFPGMIVPLFVGREKSVKALEEVMRDDKHILVVTQKNAQDDDPKPGDIFATGTIASVLQLLKLPDGTVKVLVEGLHRATIDHYLQTEDYFEAQATTLDEPEGDAVEVEALARSAQTEFENYVKLNKKISAEVVNAVNQIENASKLADTIAQPPRDQDHREGRSALDRFGRRAPAEDPRPHGGRDRCAAGRKAHPLPRQAADGEDAARVLSQRADEGDPARAGRRRGGLQRAHRARRAHQEDQAVEGSPHQGRRRAQEAQVDVARCRPKRRSSATISTGCSRSPGARSPRSSATSTTPRKCSTPITTASRRSRNASSSISPCSPAPASSRARSSASSALRASARPRSASRSPRPPAASSSAWRWAACATRPRSAVTAAPISARCPARSSSR